MRRGEDDGGSDVAGRDSLNSGFHWWHRRIARATEKET